MQIEQQDAGPGRPLGAAHRLARGARFALWTGVCAGLLLLPPAVLDGPLGEDGGLLRQADAGESDPQPVPQPVPQPGRGAAESSSVAPKLKAAEADGWAAVPLPLAVHKGLKWLVIAQHKNGGWSQNGKNGQASVAPPSGRRPSKRGGRGAAPGFSQPGSAEPDVGNTALATLAIMEAGCSPRAGVFQGPLNRGVHFILAEVERAPEKGLGITERTGTLLQRKIGRYADTFLAARVLLRAEGQMRSARENKRMAQAVSKIIAKIQTGQAADGSWNIEGGWAPIHSTAYASQALWEARRAGYEIDPLVLQRVNRFTLRQMRVALRPVVRPPAPPVRRGGKIPPVVTPAGGPVMSRDSAGAAGVLLYSISQGIEQLTRTPQARRRNARQIQQIEQRVDQEAILKGLGSMGGEEFISYTNINLALARMGGEHAQRWNKSMQERLTGLQNADGSWSGHHCITGRTAVTGLAITTLLAERSVPRRD